MSRGHLRIVGADYRLLHDHLFPGDGEEHGAVIAARRVETARGVRLLVRRVFLADEGVDFIHTRDGYALAALFVAKTADWCRDHNCVWLSVHNHGPGDRVAFSRTDRGSHQRLYPALLNLVLQPVGALVFASAAVAGELWLADESRVSLAETTIIGDRWERLYPVPPTPPANVSMGAWARQALMLGARGQTLLREMKVGVIGAGGGGSLLLEELDHLGLGEIISVDPDRIDISNLSRITGSRRRDALAFLAERRSPLLRRLARRLARPKVRVAKRVAKAANPGGVFMGLHDDVCYSEVARQFVDCDFLFCATDTMTSRLLFNTLCHQYLIPGIQLGVKIPVDPIRGVGPIHVALRPVTLDHGCLTCAGAISQRLLHAESIEEADLRRQRYVDDPDVEQASVVSLNGIAASHAASDFILYVTGLLDDGTTLRHQLIEPQTRSISNLGVRRDPLCAYCGREDHSVFAAGDVAPLPTKHRP